MGILLTFKWEPRSSAPPSFSCWVNSSVGTCAGWLIAQHLKVSHFCQTAAEEPHIMSYQRWGGKNAIRPFYQEAEGGWKHRRLCWTFSVSEGDEKNKATVSACFTNSLLWHHRGAVFWSYLLLPALFYKVELPPINLFHWCSSPGSLALQKQNSDENKMHSVICFYFFYSWTSDACFRCRGQNEGGRKPDSIRGTREACIHVHSTGISKRCGPGRAPLMLRLLIPAYCCSSGLNAITAKHVRGGSGG